MLHVKHGHVLVQGDLEPLGRCGLQESGELLKRFWTLRHAGAWLDTFEFQARGFYEGIGYECFGELPNYPKGFSRFFMKKTLRRASR